jgi:hypothetical protein
VLPNTFTEQDFQGALEELQEGCEIFIRAEGVVFKDDGVQ